MRPTMLNLNLLATKLSLNIRAYTLVAIPRGGVPAALLLARHMKPQPAVVTIDEVEINSGHSPYWIVDDIAATGNTLEAARAKLGDLVAGATVLYTRSTAVAADYGEYLETDDWVEFPWEAKEQGGKPLDAVTRLIEYAGDDPTRPGLVETPARVLRFLDEIKERPYEPTVFASAIEDLQVTANISFFSLCEHHLLPYWGTAAIGYIPNGELLGLSKMARALAASSAGLTMQEQVTSLVAERVARDANTPDVAVITRAEHSCMIARGVKAVGSYSASSSMLGKFRESSALRAEFMALARLRD